MKNAALALALLASAAVGASASAALAQGVKAPAAAAAVELQGAARTEALKLASAALNNAQKVRGRFLQIAPGNRASQGAFYLQRPGKLRFEYDSPNPLTIVSNGNVVSIEDRALKTVEQYPLRATPLYFVLKQQVNLDVDGRVTRVIRAGDSLQVTLRDRKGEAEGAITLYFDAPSKELRQWRIVDGQGAVTQVSLTNATSVAAIDPKLFVPKPMPRAGTARP